MKNIGRLLVWLLFGTLGFSAGAEPIAQLAQIEATSELEQTLKQAPQNHGIRLILVQTYMQAGDSVAAREHIELALRDRGITPELNIQFRLALAELEPESAPEQLEQVLKVPLTLSPKLAYIKTYFQRRKSPVLKQSLEPLIALYSSASESEKNQLIQLIFIATLDVEDQPQLKLRTAVLESLVQANPQDKLAQTALIRHYQNHGLLEHILSYYRAALVAGGSRLTPIEQSQLYYKIGQTHLALGYTQFAFDNYERAVELDVDNIAAQNQMGLIYLITHHYNQAIELFEGSLKSYPLNHEARLYLATALALNKQPDLAMTHLNALPDSMNAQKNWIISVIQYQKQEPMNQLWKVLRPQENPVQLSR